MRMLLPLIALTGLTGCTSASSINPETWSCQNLIEPIIAMSKERSPSILELTQPVEIINANTGPTPYIECRGIAVLSQGNDTQVQYGARVTESGNLILQYQ